MITVTGKLIQIKPKKIREHSRFLLKTEDGKKVIISVGSNAPHPTYATFFLKNHLKYPSVTFTMHEEFYINRHDWGAFVCVGIRINSWDVTFLLNNVSINSFKKNLYKRHHLNERDKEM